MRRKRKTVPYTLFLKNLSLLQAALLSNAGFFLGRLISKTTGKHLQEAISLLQTMCQRHVRDVGRQLAGR